MKLICSLLFSLLILTSCTDQDLGLKKKDDGPSDSPAVSKYLAPPLVAAEVAETSKLFPIERLADGVALNDSQPNQVLELLDQEEGTQADWNLAMEYMEIKPLQTQSAVSYKFSLGKSVEKVEALKLSFNYYGYPASTQEWQFELRDLESGEWVKVANNAEVTPWQWSFVTISIPNPERFMNLNGNIELRFKSDFSLSAQYQTSVYLDYLALELLSL